MPKDNTVKKIFMKYWFLFFGLSPLFHNATGQQFSNLNFQQTCDSSKTGLCYWNLSWGGKMSIRPVTIDNEKCLQIIGETENSVGFAEQEAKIDNPQGIVIITISAFIKSDNIIGKGAGLNIGLYDKTGTLIANKDMGGFYSLDWIRATAGFRKYSISIVSPTETAKIKIGAILYGKGTVYFKDYNVSVESLKNRRPSELAIQYIQAACDTIKMNSLVRDSIDIKQLKETALAIAGDAKMYSDCYLSINFLLESLRPFGDEHSFFMSAAEVINWESEGSQVSKIEYPTFKIIDSCGYILVPPFHGGNQEQILAFADTLQKGIQRLFNSHINGWIVDLRQNTGGNMSPMIAGLGPLFRSEKLGSLIDVNGKSNSWYYNDGKYYWDNDPGWLVSKPVSISNKFPIAVLTDGQTGSSGEAVVVSFIGNDKTKLFGQPTWGLTTGNGNFKLQDGSEIFLASTIYADRNENTYRGSISPDFIIDNKSASQNDMVMEAAINWLQSQE